MALILEDQMSRSPDDGVPVRRPEAAGRRDRVDSSPLTRVAPIPSNTSARLLHSTRAAAHSREQTFEFYCGGSGTVSAGVWRDGARSRPGSIRGTSIVWNTMERTLR